jgi:hypothetical protein
MNMQSSQRPGPAVDLQTPELFPRICNSGCKCPETGRSSSELVEVDDSRRQ